MSYQEKRTLVSILSGICLLAAYCIYAFGRVAAGDVPGDDLHFWAETMLIFTGIGVGATIIIQILFHIAFAIGIAIQKKLAHESCDDKEIERQIKTETVEDERDRMIELKSLRFGFAFAGLGFIAGLAWLAWNGSAAVMLNILFLSFGIGSLLEGAVQFHHYRQGR